MAHLKHAARVALRLIAAGLRSILPFITAFWIRIGEVSRARPSDLPDLLDQLFDCLPATHNAFANRRASPLLPFGQAGSLATFAELCRARSEQTFIYGSPK